MKKKVERITPVSRVDLGKLKRENGRNPRESTEFQKVLKKELDRYKKKEYNNDN